MLTSVRNQNAFDRYGCFDIFTGGQGCSRNERNSGFGLQDQPQPQRGEQHLELCIYHVFVTPIALRDGCGLLCVLQLCAKCWLSYDLEQEGEAEQGEIFYRAEMFHWVLLSKQSKQVVILISISVTARIRAQSHEQNKCILVVKSNRFFASTLLN